MPFRRKLFRETRQVVTVVFFAFILIIVADELLKTGLLSSQTAADWIIALCSFVLMYYAGVQIDEGKASRRKDTIEKELEKVYSPIYDILRRSKMELWLTTREQEKEKAKQYFPTMNPSDYLISGDELETVQSIIETYGHYLDPGIEHNLIGALAEHESHSELPPSTATKMVWWHRFTAKTLDPYLRHFQEERKRLVKELEALIET